MEDKIKNNPENNIEDILGGIKNAMSRGASLKDAMQSFYNAGYKKEDIEAAARVIQEQGVMAVAPSGNIAPVRTTMIAPAHIPSPPQGQTGQIVSQYGSQNPVRLNEAPSGKLGWIILILGLVVIASLTAILLIFFKEQLLEFFSG